MPIDENHRSKNATFLGEFAEKSLQHSLNQSVDDDVVKHEPAEKHSILIRFGKPHLFPHALFRYAYFSDKSNDAGEYGRQAKTPGITRG